MIELQVRSDGVVLPVRAQPGARKSAVRGEQNGMLKVSVTQAPEKGKANQAIIELLAAELGVRKAQIALLSGTTSHQKKFLISGLDRETLAARLAPLRNA